jgi:hypothetical protein
LRQSFLNGSLTRLLDPDTVLRTRIPEFVARGDFGLASGAKADGTYERVWYPEDLASEEVSFEPGVFLLLREKAKILKSKAEPAPHPAPGPGPEPEPESGREPWGEPAPEPGPATRTIRLRGPVPPEIWNRLGTKIIPKLRSGKDVKVEVGFSTTIDAKAAANLESDLRQLIHELGLAEKIQFE